jgi:Flp pilus assembly protein TadG
MTARRLGRRLRRNERGAALVEFAVVAPVFLLLVLGFMESGYAIYVAAVLNGAVQSAGRSSGLESGHLTQTQIDARVRARVRAVMPDAAVAFSRANYQNFADLGRPEDFNDANHNGVRDARECFSDENGNQQWDDDVGRAGQGGANDVVLYTARVQYRSFIPLAPVLGLPAGHHLSASTTLRNQPFATQPTRQVVQVCS